MIQAFQRGKDFRSTSEIPYPNVKAPLCALRVLPVFEFVADKDYGAIGTMETLYLTAPKVRRVSTMATHHRFGGRRFRSNQIQEAGGGSAL